MSTDVIEDNETWYHCEITVGRVAGGNCAEYMALANVHWLSVCNHVDFQYTV